MRSWVRAVRPREYARGPMSLVWHIVRPELQLGTVSYCGCCALGVRETDVARRLLRVCITCERLATRQEQRTQ